MVPPLVTITDDARRRPAIETAGRREKADLGVPQSGIIVSPRAVRIIARLDFGGDHGILRLPDEAAAFPAPCAARMPERVAVQDSRLHFGQDRRAERSLPPDAVQRAQHA